MTTTAKPVTDATETPPEPQLVAEPQGTIRLKLAPLGIDHRAADFPVRFIEFCEQNDLYQMEVNARRRTADTAHDRIPRQPTRRIHDCFFGQLGTG